MQATSTPRGKKRLSIVTPCFNEEAGLVEFHRRVTLVCSAAAGASYEIVLINDGSTDGTLDGLMALAAADPHVVVLDLARNYGHQIALSAGLELCTGERILILDADLQDPPELLAQMMEEMDRGADVVLGQRRTRQGESWFKINSARAFYRLLQQLVDVKLAMDTGDFRLMSRRALDHLNAMPERYRFIRGMVSWLGLRQTAILYDRDPRFAGETHYPLRKMIALALDAVTSFSVVPLRLASHLGFFMGLMGIFALIYTVASWATGHAVPGWTSLAVLVLIIGSGQFLVLGIFGEYLGRMYMETKRRPLYIINQIHASPAVEASGEDARGLQENLKQVLRA
ncbi:MAG: glycosyltransferase family 2 protein [Candidatus Devosia phytovorans]|uniref:Glycosyltransferase family 2 protein n=1 Tax=Candidatus Devosia phytovorans TaxID=3121372 RepID=A0AAJ6B1W3_9HYPH|nr:glycosyltransferase family 2 protein [Devosia sp.]WEK04853.1 MAG: glycosyltransferase family 2 protein [Devosia sp.]